MLLSPTIVKCYSKLLEIGSSICSRCTWHGWREGQAVCSAECRMAAGSLAKL